MRSGEYETYQAFFLRQLDGSFLGWIAHDTSHVEPMMEQNLGKHDDVFHARSALLDAVATWARSKGLSRLPAPAKIEEVPDDLTVLTIEIPQLVDP